MSDEKENNTSSILLLLIGTVVSCVLLALILANSHKNIIETIVGAPVIARKCDNKGCSFLIEYPNREHVWVWAPKPIQEKNQKTNQSEQ